eukprot:455178_1
MDPNQQMNWFVGVFLALSLVFLTSLYLKYGKTMRQRTGSKDNTVNEQTTSSDDDSKTPGVAVTASTADSTSDQYDIHKLAQTLRADPDNVLLIDQAFRVSLQVLTKLPKEVKVSTEIQLELYGLFKQCNIGDINIEEPTRLYYADHAKWAAWNQHKGKSTLVAKREYFDVVYEEIAKPSGLNILLFNAMEQMPEHLRQAMQSSTIKRSQGFSMAAPNSKITEKFDEELHGDPNELFNKFDLTEEEIDLEEIKKYIESNKININKQNENGTTFLNFAVDNDKYELSKVLIQEFDANVNLCDDMGYTALHSAAMNGNKEIIALLLENGADVNAKSLDDEETPADLAESDEIKQLLTV